VRDRDTPHKCVYSATRWPALSGRGHGGRCNIRRMPLELSPADLETAARACRATAYQESEHARKMENPSMRGPVEAMAPRYAELAAKSEVARKARSPVWHFNHAGTHPISASERLAVIAAPAYDHFAIGRNDDFGTSPHVGRAAKYPNDGADGVAEGIAVATSAGQYDDAGVAMLGEARVIEKVPVVRQ
jgi:hypothetical protein